MLCTISVVTAPLILNMTGSVATRPWWMACSFVEGDNHFTSEGLARHRDPSQYLDYLPGYPEYIHWNSRYLEFKDCWSTWRAK